MKYENIYEGIFLSRPNRFIAMVEINGVEEVCHVKNTGRCKELLIPGVKVYLERCKNPNRKTKYDLIGVDKKGVCINMDSQAPNKVALEWLKKQGWDYIKPEYKYGKSRIDFYMEKDTPKGKQKALMEVKGVTLEENGIARFPDAPTERGIKHIEELIKATEQYFQTYILFVIQLKGICHFEPNDATHPAFGEALRKAKMAGVKLLAYDCLVTQDSLEIDCPVEIQL